MLSDKVPHRNNPPRRSVSNDRARWSDKQKLEAVQTYLLLGSIQLVSAVLKIPEQTLFLWKRSEWWNSLVDDIRIQENLTLSTNLKRIIDKSVALVEDRLDKGDFIYDQKKGELVRKPVVMKDAQKVLVDLIDKRKQLTNQENYIVAEEGIKEKLEKLAKSFEAFANKQEGKPVIEVTDVIFGTEVENDNDGEVSEGSDGSSGDGDEYPEGREA